MRHRVEFERRGLTQDSVGQQIDTWESIGSAMVSIDPIRGREYYNASGEKADITHEIRCRAQDFRLYPRDRVIYGDRHFDIKSAIDISERGREWLLMVTEALHTNG